MSCKKPVSINETILSRVDLNYESSVEVLRAIQKLSPTFRPLNVIYTCDYLGRYPHTNFIKKTYHEINTSIRTVDTEQIIGLNKGDVYINGVGCDAPGLNKLLFTVLYTIPEEERRNY